MATIEERYLEKFAGSAQWNQRGMALSPGGRGLQTQGASFPLCFESGKGPYKYDVDGNEIIDYGMGSGSLIMGHSPPEVTEAIAAQNDKGSLVGGSPTSGLTTHQIRYAEAVQRLMPSLERVRFTTAGTSATYMAVRLARAFTGKSKLVKFHEHFHGWHDYVMPNRDSRWAVYPRPLWTA